ncbi:MAG: MFS transporter [Micromonosporaceae bacterium]|nr:MFS transporter [Micromonosporaceae bacterium]
MSSETTADDAPAEEAATGPLGVLATWRHTPGPVKAVLAGVFVNRLGGFLQIFLVLFLTDRGYTSSQAGLALGLYGAGAVAGTFAGGWLSDRLSARTVTLISMMGSALLLVAILYFKVYLLLLLVAILVGAVSQLYRPAAQAMVTELTPVSRLVMVTAMYRLCLNLGTTAAPLIGVALASVSYDLLFWAEALAALTYGLIALVALPRGRRVRPSAPEQAQERPPRSGYLALLDDWRYLVFLAAFLLLCVVYSQYTAALPLAIVGAGLSTWWYGAVVTVNAFIVVTCEVVATRWVQTWPLRLTQMSGFALLAIGYGIYAIDMIPLFLILGTLVWTLSEIIGAPTIYAYPGLVAPAHLRGRYFGAMQGMFGLGSTLGPILGIALFERVGQQMFMWAALVAVLATVIGRVGMRGTQKPDPAPEPAASQPAG